MRSQVKEYALLSGSEGRHEIERDPPSNQAGQPAADSFGHEGSYPYPCHLHAVKHLEMGMYGAIIVRPRDASG
ncbi:MAG: hypothetical protein ACU83V_06575 [Gammaproteobacteria bacterium]